MKASVLRKKNWLIQKTTYLKNILTCRILNSDGNDLVLQDGICHSIWLLKKKVPRLDFNV